VNQPIIRFEQLDFLGPDRGPDQLEGLKVLVLGLGTHGGGTDLVHFLHSKGAIVTVSDHAPRSTLNASIELIDSIIPEENIHLGGHQADHLRGIDWAVINPAIPPAAPFLQHVYESGVRPVTELGLFLAWAPHQHLAAVTGTNGKSTVCALAHDMISASGLPVRVGGNFGGSLLSQLESCSTETRWIVEISSFQASRLGTEIPRPPVVALTPFAPDHLDWHGDEETYFQAKLNLLRPPHRQSQLVIAAPDSPFVAAISELETAPNLISMIDPELQTNDYASANPNLDGVTGRSNLALAMTLAKKLGATKEGCQTAAKSFSGLPHRFEVVTRKNGVTFINDSKATTPDATISALDRIEGRVIWLCGGKDKGIDLDPLASSISKRNIHIFAYGDSADRLLGAIKSRAPHNLARRCDHLDEAFESAVDLCQPGDTILLSPAFPSYDQYTSFEERGEHFRNLVIGLEE